MRYDMFWERSNSFEVDGSTSKFLSNMQPPGEDGGFHRRFGPHESGWEHTDSAVDTNPSSDDDPHRYPSPRGTADSSSRDPQSLQVDQQMETGLYEPLSFFEQHSPTGYAADPSPRQPETLLHLPPRDDSHDGSSLPISSMMEHLRSPFVPPPFRGSGLSTHGHQPAGTGTHPSMMQQLFSQVSEMGAASSPPMAAAAAFPASAREAFLPPAPDRALRRPQRQDSFDLQVQQVTGPIANQGTVDIQQQLPEATDSTRGLADEQSLTGTLRQEQNIFHRQQQQHPLQQHQERPMTGPSREAGLHGEEFATAMGQGNTSNEQLTSVIAQDSYQQLHEAGGVMSERQQAHYPPNIEQPMHRQSAFYPFGQRAPETIQPNYDPQHVQQRQHLLQQQQQQVLLQQQQLLQQEHQLAQGGQMYNPNINMPSHPMQQQHAGSFVYPQEGQHQHHHQLRHHQPWPYRMPYPPPTRPGLYMNYYDRRDQDPASSTTPLPIQPSPARSRSTAGITRPQQPPVAKRRKKDKNKPKRPLSAYNYFFKEERARLVAEMEKEEEEEEDAKPAATTTTTTTKQRGRGGRAKSRAGSKVGFEQMAQIVSARWRDADRAALVKYEKLAEQDLERYKNEMTAYRLSLKAARVQEAEQQEQEEESLTSEAQPQGEDTSASNPTEEAKDGSKEDSVP